MAFRGMFISMTIVVALLIPIIAVTQSSKNTLSKDKNYDLRSFCLFLALPGREHGPKISLFINRLNTGLDKVGEHLFGIKEHEIRMKEADKVCFKQSSSEPKCAYQRIAIIGKKLTEDLKRLENHVKMNPNFKNANSLYITLLSTWYMDEVFLKLDCGPVNKTNPLPVVQWKTMAKWSKHLLSKRNFCTWSKVLHKTIAINLRQEVKETCDKKDDGVKEPICRLESTFELVDKIGNLCSMFTEKDWRDGSEKLTYLKSAVYINFFSLRSKMPPEISKLYTKHTSKDAIKNYLHVIFEKLYIDFKANDLSLAKDLLDVLPNSKDLPCDFTAQFPSFEWLICSTAKSMEELRFYIKAYVNTNGKTRRQKLLRSDIDLREYIKNIKTSQIKELAEKNSFSLQVVAADIQNNVQERFQQLGTYFRNVANYQRKTLKGDVEYIRGRIKMYQRRFEINIKQLTYKLIVLISTYIGTAFADLRQAITMLVIKLAMSGNPLKWLFDSGNADEVLESATAIAESTRRLFEALGSIVHFYKLHKYSKSISKKIDNNQKIIKSVKDILDNAERIVDSSGDQFEAQQSYFLNYEYFPQVTREDLVKLNSYWELFIGDICDGIASSTSIIANVIRGATQTAWICREAKIRASQLVATQEEIYGLQFVLMETMANLMGSLTQIQSAKILGSGAKVKYPEKLSINNIKILMAISSMSYDILQTTNVENLCNEMEYLEGIRPTACNGLATNIDKLLAQRNHKCRYEVKYMTVTTKKSSKTSNYSWIDMERLYKGEIVPFQVPNSKWLMEHANIFPSQMHHSIFLAAFVMYMPIRSEKERHVKIHLTPTNVDNKLREDSNINYIVMPLKSLDSSYIEGYGSRCMQSKIDNPYSTCGRNKRQEFPKICPVSQGTKRYDETLLPSVYTKFHLLLEGYENLHISKPTTDVPVHIGIRICTVNPFESSSYNHVIGYAGRRSIGSKCCPNEKQYFSESTRKCEQCPVGSKSYYNSLFCGEVIDIRFPISMKGPFTYNDAVQICQQHGTTVASKQLLLEARSLGQKSCDCGWLQDSNVDSLTSRNDCNKKKCKKTNGIRLVHCKAVFTA